MCGRFVLTSDGKAIQQKFDLDHIPEIQARYNIAPSQPVAVISNENPKELTHYKWGLVPSWSKDLSIGNKLINARGETVDEKPSFRAAFKRRRCLIPANGFYEWTKTDDGKGKKPMYLHLHEQELFAFAGLWEIWYGPDGEELRTCTIITTTPNDLVKPLHNRMAVILSEEDYDLWLSPEELPAMALKPLIKPYEADRMDVYEVSTLVNRPANDLPECIIPVEPPHQQQMMM